MSSTPGNQSHTSQERQKQIFSDISLIIKLISCYKKGKQNQKPKNAKNPQGVSSLSLINPSSFSNGHSSFSAYDFANFYSSYKQYGKSFDQLTYSNLLYLLCRKKIQNQFIMEFIHEKYSDKAVNNLHYKVIENIKAIMQAKQPQLSLSQCVIAYWSQILSKEDVFEDTVQLLGWNIQKNWRLNNIKLQKKLEKSQNFSNEGCKIFQTEPSLENIAINPFQTAKSENRKKVIQESTRHILSGLQQLKKEMSECQAEMNMAKNNDQRIIEKGKEYNQKKRQYNQLKEAYRKRTITKDKTKKTLSGQTNTEFNQRNDSITQKEGKTKNNDHANKYTNEFMGSQNELSKIKEQGAQSVDKEEQENGIESNRVNDFSEETPIYPKKKLQKGIEKVAKFAQDSELSVSIVLGDESKSQQKIKQPIKINNNPYQPKPSLHTQPLKPYECDQLVRILDFVRKNEMRQNRIKTLTQKKDSTPLQVLKPFKKITLSIDVRSPQKPYNKEYNAEDQPQSSYKSPKLQQSPAKSDLRSPQNMITQSSPKQFLLQNYIQKVFNHYILQQSKMKTIHLFDNSLSGHELGYNSLIGSNIKGKHQSRLSDVSPHLRKKFSVEVSQHAKKDTIAYDVLQERRRKSLSYAIDRSSHNISNKNIQNSKKRTHANSISIKKKQAQLNIESYSKFIRAFELATQTVTFNQIIKLFKQKSDNKKMITYDQFIELFELIYRLECEKLQVQFTPFLFDAYLRKEVFDWNKINKVLRIKTVGLHPQKGELRYNHNDLSAGKGNLVGHSGMLTQDLIEKINASKKPFIKMPCMNQNHNRFKTLPSNVSQQLPQTKIQQKVQEIKRFREIQKTKKIHQLQEYLRQARQRDQALMTIKDQLREKTQDSYAMRFKNLEGRRKQAQENKKHSIYVKNSIINQSKLRKQLRIDTIEKNQNQEQRPIKRSDMFYSDKEKQKEGIVQKLRHRLKTMKALDGSIMFDLNRQIQMKRQNSSHSGSQRKVNNEQNTQRRKQRDDVMELEKIIGLRDSEDEYDDDYQNQIQDIVNKNVSRPAQHNYGQEASMPVSKMKNVLNPNLLSIGQKNGQNSHTQIGTNQLKHKKQSDEDEYLASYLKKHSFQAERMNMVEDEPSQRDWLKNYDRQNWRVHF